MSVTVTTKVRRRTPGDRHFADQAVTSLTAPQISVFIHDEAINGKTNDGQHPSDRRCLRCLRRAGPRQQRSDHREHRRQHANPAGTSRMGYVCPPGIPGPTDGCRRAGTRNRIGRPVGRQRTPKRPATDAEMNSGPGYFARHCWSLSCPCRADSVSAGQSADLSHRDTVSEFSLTTNTTGQSL